MKGLHMLADYCHSYIELYVRAKKNTCTHKPSFPTRLGLLYLLHTAN